MNGADAATLATSAIAAAIFTWFVGSVTLRLLGEKKWSTAVPLGLGLAILSLALLVSFRVLMPDMFVVPLVSLTVCGAILLDGKRSLSRRRRLAISIVVSMTVVGALVLIDGLLRLSGYRLSLGL